MCNCIDDKFGNCENQSCNLYKNIESNYSAPTNNYQNGGINYGNSA